MKILIVGRVDSLIKSIAHRFYKEGSKVFILSDDELREPYYKNYKLDSLNYKYDYIFKNTYFDKVIYINHNIESSILLNILELSKTYETSQIIMVNLKNKSKEHILCENIFREFKRLYDINMSILYIDRVYGEVNLKEKEDIVLNIIKDVVDNKNKNYDNRLKNGYIHSLDVAEAVYLLSKYNINKEYYICGYELASDKDIYNLVLSTIKNKDIYTLEKINTKDFKEFKEDTNFYIKFSLSKEIITIYNKYINESNNTEKIKAIKKDKKQNKFIKVTKPYVENIGMFLIVCFISSFLSRNNSIFTIIDLKIIYIIVIGMMHGMKQSVIASILSCLLLISNQLSQGISIISIFVLSQSLVQMLMYVLLGIYTGYASDFKNNQIKELKRINEEKDSKYEFLEDIYNSTYEEKRELEEKVISSKDSFGKIYSYVKELDSLKPQYILRSSIDIMEEFLENNNISIYTLNNDYLRLNVKSNNKDFNPLKSIKINDLYEAKDKLLNKEIYINKNLNPKLPSMVAPIVKDNKIISIIMVDKIKFSKMNLYYQNLFKVIVSLIETSIIKAYNYEEATIKQRYIDETIFLRKEYLKSALKVCEISKKEKKSDYTLLKVDMLNDINYLSKEISKCIRSTDLAGVCNNHVYIILNNTNKEESSVVVSRLIGKNLTVKIVDGVDEDD